MMLYHPTLGHIKEGQKVKVLHERLEKIGKLKSADTNFKTVDLYVEDDTGAYTITAYWDSIISIVSEDIKKPERYNKRGKLECWDVILDQEMNFLEGNILKYVWRYKEKNGVEDLKKAKVYLDKLISEVEKK